MRKIEYLVNVIDVEATAWEPRDSQPIDEISEIIEIGISVLDIKSLQIVSTDSILVKPEKSKVSKFCTELTTLTQEMVDEGISFAAAVELLKNKYVSRRRTFASWGDYDRKIFEKNCQIYNLEYPFGPRHLNLKNVFSLFRGENKEFGLNEALNCLNIELEGTHHRGNWDAYNTAKIFVEMLSKFRQINNQ